MEVDRRGVQRYQSVYVEDGRDCVLWLTSKGATQISSWREERTKEELVKVGTRKEKGIEGWGIRPSRYGNKAWFEKRSTSTQKGRWDLCRGATPTRPFAGVALRRQRPKPRSLTAQGTSPLSGTSAEAPSCRLPCAFGTASVDAECHAEHAEIRPEVRGRVGDADGTRPAPGRCTARCCVTCHALPSRLEHTFLRHSCSSPLRWKCDSRAKHLSQGSGRYSLGQTKSVEDPFEWTCLAFCSTEVAQRTTP